MDPETLNTTTSFTGTENKKLAYHVLSRCSDLTSKTSSPTCKISDSMEAVIWYIVDQWTPQTSVSILFSDKYGILEPISQCYEKWVASDQSEIILCPDDKLLIYKHSKDHGFLIVDISWTELFETVPYDTIKWMYDPNKPLMTLGTKILSAFISDLGGEMPPSQRQFDPIKLPQLKKTIWAIVNLWDQRKLDDNIAVAIKPAISSSLDGSDESSLSDIPENIVELVKCFNDWYKAKESDLTLKLKGKEIKDCLLIINKEDGHNLYTIKIQWKFFIQLVPENILKKMFNHLVSL